MGSAGRHPVACGVDIGSTNTKVVALTPEGIVAARAARPTPRDAQGLSIDVPALLDAVDRMIAQACGQTYQVHAICAAGIGEDGVFVDAGLDPLCPPLTWFDPRRQGIFTALRPHLHDDETFDAASDATRAIVGWAWSLAQPLSGDPNSWIAVADIAGVRWTGNRFISDTLAARTGAWRSTDRSWAVDRVELTLGSVELLPPVIRAGQIVGALTSPTLRSAGVCAGDAVVVAGGHDHPIGGWGVHQLVPGAVLDSMGTAEVAVAQTAHPTLARPDSIDIAPGISSAGSTCCGWKSSPGTSRRRPRIMRLPRRSGSSSTDRPRRSRCSRADSSSPDNEVAAARRDVCLAGGWSRYPGWLQIKAAVNGFHALPIAEPEVTAVGAALLAATARGWSPDPAKALAGPVRAPD